MRYELRQTRQAARAITLALGSLFALFSFLWLYVLQPDYLSQLQYLMSGGQTRYVPLPGALLITLLLTGLGFLLSRFLPLPIRRRSLAWAPSCLALSLLTVWPLRAGAALPRSVFWLGLLFLVYLAAVVAACLRPDSRTERAPFLSHLVPNMLALAPLLLLAGAMSNTRSPQHYECRMARLLAARRFDDALRVGQGSRETSPRLTAMRCYALSQTGQLPERLFSYPLQGGSRQMLPSPADTLCFASPVADVYRHLGYAPRSSRHFSPVRFLERASQRDTLRASCPLRHYLLTALLLDRQLEDFARQLSQDSLPVSELSTRYREALLLHAALDSAFRSPVADTQLQTQLSRFLRMKDVADGPLLPEDRLRQDFADTYWYYYFFAPRLGESQENQ